MCLSLVIGLWQVYAIVYFVGLLDMPSGGEYEIEGVNVSRLVARPSCRN